MFYYLLYLTLVWTDHGPKLTCMHVSHEAFKLVVKTASLESLKTLSYPTPLSHLRGMSVVLRGDCKYGSLRFTASSDGVNKFSIFLFKIFYITYFRAVLMEANRLCGTSNKPGGH